MYNGNNQYLSTSELKKNIDERIQKPRSTLEHKKLKYSEICINAFRDSMGLVNERHIKVDRIANDRALLANKKLRNRTSHTGEAFEDDPIC